MNHLDRLKEERRKRQLELLNRDFKRAIKHLDEVSKLGDEAFERQNAVYGSVRNKEKQQKKTTRRKHKRV